MKELGANARNLIRRVGDADGTSVEARYVYDAGGKRVKKLVREPGGRVEVTTYIDGTFEHHRWTSRAESGQASLLHVMDDQARVATLDPRLEEAAADLGANPTQTFLRITFPLAFPGILAGALLAFSLSFDDYIITNFNASPSSITFPMYVWGASQRGAPVQVNVIGTLMFIAAFLFVILGQVLARRREGVTR